MDKRKTNQKKVIEDERPLFYLIRKSPSERKVPDSITGKFSYDGEEYIFRSKYCDGKEKPIVQASRSECTDSVIGAARQAAVDDFFQFLASEKSIDDCCDSPDESASKTNQKQRKITQKQMLWKFCDIEASHSLLPLISYLADNELEVEISGTYRADGHFIANNIKTRTSGNTFDVRSNGSSVCLKVIANRLLAFGVNRTASMEERILPRLSDSKEIETYYNVCKAMFPEWLRSAFERELEKANTRLSNSEDRKHAQHALHYLANIDWTKKQLALPSIESAKAYLDAQFYGMSNAKMRILEIVAQIKRTGKLPQYGILLVGPAGTGKTSFATAVAYLLNMPVIRVDVSSLGNDPETLSGSSRVFSNGKPGKILDSFLSVGRNDAVLLINELDKATSIGRDGKTSCSDVLLTLLDGQGFMENFLELQIPTDGLFAIATCNDIDKLSKPLRDRFLIVDIPGYTTSEKEHIWKEYVLPKKSSQFGIKDEQIAFSDEADHLVISEYDSEPGVRDLEKFAEVFCRNLCMKLEECGDCYKSVFTDIDVKKLLGPPKRKQRTFAVKPGEINSIFCYEGEAYPFLLEASESCGSGMLRILGAVPETQKDYIRAAYECIRNILQIELHDKDITIFIPHQLPNTADNYVGSAVCAAICSMLSKTSFNPKNTVFIGGVDLYGNLYSDFGDVTPVIKAVQETGIRTIYAPNGFSKVIREYMCLDAEITVIEAQNIREIITMAVSSHTGKK